jgi:7,8-dihydropterin-6-yl-methyl-4-(beta-D-ribofuranosyl)aminobenzene 5'-phosphate synthase
MGNRVEIKIVVENSVYKENLLAEHGLAFWIKMGNQEYLFDTGQGLVLENNLEELDLNINNLNGVLLSHGHYDHANGLKWLLKERPDLKLYGHSDIFIPKYSQRSSGFLYRGMNITRDDVENFIPVNKAREIEKGLWMTGEITVHNREKIIRPDYKLKIDDELKVDQFKDDQALFIETKEGIVVLLGCSHSGVVKTLKHIKKLTAGQKIVVIIGGMHLIHADMERIDSIIDYLQELNFDLLVPLHCTGFKAAAKLNSIFKDKVIAGGVGKKFSFQL